MTPHDLEQRIADLEAIADWRDELQSRIRRAHLRFEFVGLDAVEQDALEREVQQFDLVCRELSGRPAVNEVAERRAA
jgi:hypothetical protein